MTSITAFRSILLGTLGSGGIRDGRHQKNKQQRWAPSHSWIQRAMQRKASKEDDGTSTYDDHHHHYQFPSIPLATFPKIETYVPAHSSDHTHHHHVDDNV